MPRALLQTWSCAGVEGAPLPAEHSPASCRPDRALSGSVTTWLQRGGSLAGPEGKCPRTHALPHCDCGHAPWACVAHTDSAGTFSAPGSLSQGQSVTTACHQQSMWGYVTGSVCSVPLVLCSAPVEEGAAQGASA